MEDHPQPAYGHYRRVQLARYIINSGYGRYEQMDFDDRGQIVSFGVESGDLIRDGYLQLAAAEPDRFAVVDASQELEQVQAAIALEIKRLLNDSSN